ncbi:MAG: Hint domain-containing protein [Clostridium sp.]|nr:Hint domain-containing protein [Clostridium sp.]
MATILLAPQMIEDWENGDYDLAVAGGLQILSSLSMIFMKCFTGDTLVAAEDGDKRIDEISVGDSVWAEDTVTGEKVLKRVSKVYVKETDHLIHIGTSTGEEIETTENHPFYTEERGWVAASELEEGETLHTEDGSVVTVTCNRDERLKEPVKVYNLEVEGLHTYYVTADRVLVHNEYNVNGGNNKKETDSYVIEFESGKVYVGKGPKSRMEQSAKYRAKANNDTVTKKTWKKAVDEIQAFINEYLDLLNYGGPKDNRNYNAIESPGKKYYDAQLKK